MVMLEYSLVEHQHVELYNRTKIKHKTGDTKGKLILKNEGISKGKAHANTRKLNQTILIPMNKYNYTGIKKSKFLYIPHFKILKE